MTLRRRLLLMCLAVAVPVAYLLFATIGWLKDRDRRLSLERFVESQINDGVRAQCEDYPQWFLAGPRDPRPSAQDRAKPDADVYLPRPSTEPLPFEYFAYDQEFAPTSTAGPSPFPRDFKAMLRSTSTRVTGRFDTPEGTGLQTARLTGWPGSPCAVLLFRMRPVPHETRDNALLFLALTVSVFGAALAASTPTVQRIRKFARVSRESARNDYSAIAPVQGRDEISALSFDFNEAGADIRRRMVDVKDRDDALRRFITSATEEVAQPLDLFEARLGDLDRDAGLSPSARNDVRARIAEAHALAAHLHNLAAAARLRTTSTESSREAVDLNVVIAHVLRRHEVAAQALSVTITSTVPAQAVIVKGDPVLVEQAVSNLVDNAIRYNQPGGHVEVTLTRDQNGQFTLRVLDDGPTVPEDVFFRLNAIRRFRGDEGRGQQRGELGLGLAIVREVGDRFEFKWAFRRRPVGGFQAELSGAASA